MKREVSLEIVMGRDAGEGEEKGGAPVLSCFGL